MGTWCKGFWSCCKDSMLCRRVFWSCCKDFLAEPIFKKYLFSWDTVSENESDKGKLRSFLMDNLAYLFSISSNFKTKFDNKEISADLRKVFNDNKHPLSINARISEVNENEWKIRDMGKEYKIKEFDNKLKIYDLDIGWAENAEILKFYEKTIRIFKDEKSAEIMMDETKEKATLKIRDGRTIDLKVKEKDNGLSIYYVKFPHSQVWRVLATAAFVIISLFLWKILPLWEVDLMDLVIIDKPLAPWAILSLWGLILYLSLILWLPFHNIWECIERVKYYAVEEKKFRQKISGSLNVVSTLVAFSIAFIVVGLSISTPSPEELNVFKLVMGLLVVGVILLVVTMEAYGVSLNPAFDSAQIARLYTRGWWFYTFGLYSIVIALLLYVYLLEPLITIIGVIIFIVTFTIFLRTPCDIKSGYQNRRIDK